MRSIGAGVEGVSTAVLVEAAASIAGELAGRDAPEAGMAALELAEALGSAMDVMEAALARLVGRVDDCGVCGELGFASTGAWLRARLGMRDGRAAERVRLARQLPRLPEVAGRLARGALSAGYAGAIADAVARLDDADAGLGERLLLDLVGQGHTAGQVARDAAQITDLINQHRGKEKEPEDSKRGFRRSWLTKAKSLDAGLWVKGWLTPEHAAAFEQIIGPLAKPKAKGDDRDLGQRTADALMSVITEGNKSAGVTVIIDLAAFTQATGDTGPFDFTFTAQTRPGDTGTDPDHSGGNHHTDPASDLASDPDLGTAPAAGPGAKTSPDSDAGSSLGNGPHPMAGDRAAEGRPTGEPGTRETPHDLAEASGSGMWGGTGGQGPGQATDPGNPGVPTAGPPGEAIAARGDSPGQTSDPPSRPHEVSHPPAPPGRRTTDQPSSDPAHSGTSSGAGGGPPHGHEAAGEHARARTGGRIAARLLDGTPISPERARQIALNAGINALVLGRAGLPIYLGRTARFVTPAQRKVLLALYPTCCVQGCQIPAHLCEIHHLDGGWALGTPTDINKLAPACGWHNRWIDTHPHQVQQTQDDHGKAVIKLLSPWEQRTTQAA